MNAIGTITMTMREVDRLKVIEAVAECRLKPSQAADRLGLSVRQVERLVLRYRAAGVAGLVSGRRGMPRNRALPIVRWRCTGAQWDLSVILWAGQWNGRLPPRELRRWQE